MKRQQQTRLRPKGSDASGASSIRPPSIEIPAVLGLARVEGRQELQIHGRLASVTGLEELIVASRGNIVFRLNYGSPATDQVHHYGFACELTRPLEQQGDTWQFEIIARTRDGQIAGEVFVANGEGEHAARVVSGPTAPAISSAARSTAAAARAGLGTCSSATSHSARPGRGRGARRSHPERTT
jgi:hypothetical protein